MGKAKLVNTLNASSCHVSYEVGEVSPF